jgi:FkbM family methyltransferase
VAFVGVAASAPMMPPGHSYQGQDHFVIDVLDGLRGGFFLDSGASNGVSGSNSLLLETAYGWRGICVEPNDNMFVQLSRSRRCICVNCCLYDREGEVPFFEAAGVLGGIVDDYDPGHLRYAHSVVRAALGDAEPATDGVVTKPARTIRAVLREHAAPRVIDYWSLDTEGSELAILRSFPFDEYTVRVLTVEHNFTPARAAIRELLESRGYRLARSLGIDDGYVLDASRREQAWRSAAWRSRR